MELNKEQIKMVTFALKVVEEEYRHVSAQTLSSTMKDGFLEDANRYADLATAIQNYAAKPSVIDQLQRGNVILAIKTYREQTGLPLKESKEAVEQIGIAAGLMHNDQALGGRVVLNRSNL